MFLALRVPRDSLYSSKKVFHFERRKDRRKGEGMKVKSELASVRPSVGKEVRTASSKVLAATSQSVQSVNVFPDIH